MEKKIKVILEPLEDLELKLERSRDGLEPSEDSERELLSLDNVIRQRELFKSFLEKVVEETEVGDLTWQTRDEAKELLKLFNCG
jgi:hypothetical protein